MAFQIGDWVRLKKEHPVQVGPANEAELVSPDTYHVIVYLDLSEDELSAGEPRAREGSPATFPETRNTMARPIYPAKVENTLPNGKYRVASYITLRV